MVCTNCGKELTESAKFCDGCGTPVVLVNEEAKTTIKSEVANNEDGDNKTVFILSYLLFFLPLISCPKSKTGRFHANQGLVLLITSVIGQIIVTIITSILHLISLGFWIVTSLISWGWAIVIIALLVTGMMNANKGLKKPLPVIGKITIIK